MIDKMTDRVECILQSTHHIEEEIINFAKKGDIKSLSKFIAESYNIDGKDYIGRTAMHHCCQGGFYECVKLLVANGATINICDWNMVYPLHLAAKGNYINIVKFLILSNAKWDVQCRNGCRPIDYVPYDSELWKILHNASEGKMPVLDHLLQTLDVPLIPVHAILPTKIGSAKKKGGKKSGKKKGGKKKSGKKKKK